MSGGYFNYAYSSFSGELGIPSGHYGIGTHPYYNDYRNESISKDPMHDPEISELMYDISCLLHSLEWFESCDTSEECYAADVRAFKEKWFGRTAADSYSVYREELTNMLKDLEKYI